MAIRQIIQIDEDKCTGCGLCVPSCAEGALQIIDGKAKLVSDVYCDGLGACLGDCPEGALKVIEREAVEFDEEVTEEHLKKIGREPMAAAEEEPSYEAPRFQCPSSQTATFNENKSAAAGADVPSALTHWPVKIQLVAPQSPFLKNADLLIAADCAPFAYGNFHRDFMQGKVVIIGCPKLNDSELYYKKILDIIKENDLNSITVAHMQVPCCFGLMHLVDEAVKASGKDIKAKKIVVGIKGDILES